MSLDGHVAVITGASGGIGRPLAVGLARAGMGVGLIGRNLTRLDAALREVVEGGGKGVALAADVTVPGEVEGAVEAITRDLGPVALLVNNAARIERQELPVWETDPKEWWSVIETNLRGPFLLSRAVLPAMIERRQGRIVNINTGLALRNEPYYSGYAASKAALFRLSGAIAEAGAPYGIKSFEVSPGIVQTPMSTSMPMHRGREEWTPASAVTDIVIAIALGRLDELSGRYLRAGVDEVESLRAWAGWIAEQDARTLRLRPYGTDDPLA